ncbi:hypothetical protein Tco_1068098 [Tanacetum coccineum]|uniref:Uncharacterized protein n=1 Tax=Tanacetum coccineum TaxID=301880 RepID=A0ABQ5HG73_9ASTR
MLALSGGLSTREARRGRGRSKGRSKEGHASMDSKEATSNEDTYSAPRTTSLIELWLQPPFLPAGRTPNPFAPPQELRDWIGNISMANPRHMASQDDNQQPAAPAMTQASIRKLVADSVATALEEQVATMENADNTNRNTRPTELQ